jgi:hypothetical protein
VAEWSRVTSLTIHAGRLFASIGSCTSALVDAPADVRGQVYSMMAGQCVSYDRDLGPGWKHLAALRRQNRLELFIDGKLAARSAPFDAGHYDLTNGRPLRIGFGQAEYFDGRIRHVRLYNRALSDSEITLLAEARPQ